MSPAPVPAPAQPAQEGQVLKPRKGPLAPHSAQSCGPRWWPRGLALCPVPPSWQEGAVGAARPLYPTAILSGASGWVGLDSTSGVNDRTGRKGGRPR